MNTITEKRKLSRICKRTIFASRCNLYVASCVVSLLIKAVYKLRPLLTSPLRYNLVTHCQRYLPASFHLAFEAAAALLLCKRNNFLVLLCAKRSDAERDSVESGGGSTKPVTVLADNTVDKMTT